MTQRILLFGVFTLIFSACQSPDQQVQAQSGKEIYKIKDYIRDLTYDKYEVATLAGGCFWCVEASFERINGVMDVISGYSGGQRLTLPIVRSATNRPNMPKQSRCFSTQISSLTKKFWTSFSWHTTLLPSIDKVRM